MSQSITYPNGETLTTSELSVRDVQVLLQKLTCNMLGIVTDPMQVLVTLTAGQVAAAVPALGVLAAGQTISGDGIPAGTYVAGADARLGEIIPSAAATTSGTISATVTDPNCYAKVRVDWQPEGQPFPGPNEDVAFLRATERDDPYNRIREQANLPNAAAHTVSQQSSWTRCWELRWEFWGPNAYERGCLVRDGLLADWASDVLAGANLYIVAEVDRIDRVPQQFQGAWREVAYLSAEFYEAVTQTLTVPTGNSVEIIVQNKSGVLADRTIAI